MKTTITLLFFTISQFIFAQVNIPNTVFETQLINLAIDSDGVVNGQISNIDALSINTLDISNLNISDITGINGFQNLTALYANGNTLSSVSLNLPILETLTLDNNNLTTIDLTNMPLLKIFNARNNTLLSQLIPNSNSPFTEVRLSNCNFTSNIQLAYFPSIQIIEFSGNPIASMNTNGANDLQFLAVDNCGLTSLDLTTNVNLTNLTAINNDLVCLDLSQNILLTNLEINNNDPNLDIVVADVTAAIAGTGIYSNWYKDATASYTTTCGTANVQESILESSFTIYPNPTTDNVTILSEYNATYQLFDSNGRNLLYGDFQNGTNTINLQSLQSGLYFIKIVVGEQLFNSKIIKK